MMNYMLERWESLTRFLGVGGVPLDNNASERLLKTSILHRKNSPQCTGLGSIPVSDLRRDLRIFTGGRVHNL